MGHLKWARTRALWNSKPNLSVMKEIALRCFLQSIFEGNEKSSLHVSYFAKKLVQ